MWAQSLKLNTVIWYFKTWGFFPKEKICESRLYELTRRDLCFAAGFGTLGKTQRISEM